MYISNHGVVWWIIQLILFKINRTTWINTNLRVWIMVNINKIFNRILIVINILHYQDHNHHEEYDDRGRFRHEWMLHNNSNNEWIWIWMHNNNSNRNKIILNNLIGFDYVNEEDQIKREWMEDIQIKREWMLWMLINPLCLRLITWNHHDCIHLGLLQH